MEIVTPRFALRDLVEADRAAFLAYQTDPRYRRLYDLDVSYVDQASSLFSRFLAWQRETPRQNYQLGIFQHGTRHLFGCAGLRRDGANENEAVLGIELAPDDWGRYRLALDTAEALIEFGFGDLRLNRIVGSTSSGNRRVEKLAQWFGASIIAERQGADWMSARGWIEVDWVLTRKRWEESRGAGTFSGAAGLS